MSQIGTSPHHPRGRPGDQASNYIYARSTSGPHIYNITTYINIHRFSVEFHRSTGAQGESTHILIPRIPGHNIQTNIPLSAVHAGMRPCLFPPPPPSALSHIQQLCKYSAELFKELHTLTCGSYIIQALSGSLEFLHRYILLWASGQWPGQHAARTAPTLDTQTRRLLVVQSSNTLSTAFCPTLYNRVCGVLHLLYEGVNKKYQYTNIVF